MGFRIARTLGLGAESQGPKPPDLEEFLRRGQDKLRGLLPGNLGGRGLALIVLWRCGAFPASSASSPMRSAWCCASASSCAKSPGINYHLP